MLTGDPARCRRARVGNAIHFIFRDHRRSLRGPIIRPDAGGWGIAVRGRWCRTVGRWPSLTGAATGGCLSWRSNAVRPRRSRRAKGADPRESPAGARIRAGEGRGRPTRRDSTVDQARASARSRAAGRQFCPCGVRPVPSVGAQFCPCGVQPGPGRAPRLNGRGSDSVGATPSVPRLRLVKDARKLTRP